MIDHSLARLTVARFGRYGRFSVHSGATDSIPARGAGAVQRHPYNLSNLWFGPESHTSSFHRLKSVPHHWVMGLASWVSSRGRASPRTQFSPLCLGLSSKTSQTQVRATSLWESGGTDPQRRGHVPPRSLRTPWLSSNICAGWHTLPVGTKKATVHSQLNCGSMIQRVPKGGLEPPRGNPTAPSRQRVCQFHHFGHLFNH